MSDIQFFTKCESCRKRSLVIMKRNIVIPTGQTAKSQKRMCRKCYKGVIFMLQLNKHENESK